MNMFKVDVQRDGIQPVSSFGGVDVALASGEPVLTWQSHQMNSASGGAGIALGYRPTNPKEAGVPQGWHPPTDIGAAPADESGNPTGVTTMGFGGIRSVRSKSSMQFSYRWDGADPKQHPGYGATIIINVTSNPDGTQDPSAPTTCTVRPDKQSVVPSCEVSISPQPQGGQGLSSVDVALRL